MRILYLDLDTLRPDHLGCYGYHRNTSPNIDSIASDSVRFDNFYCTDAPCLPSRTALMSGMFGIHTGVVGHGGTAADYRLEGKDRGFRTNLTGDSLPGMLRQAGLKTVSISPFAERHSSFTFYAGFSEMHNTGVGGNESAEEVTPTVMKWIDGNATDDDWFLQINYWDAHTIYRAPAEYGNPFENEPLPELYTQELIDEQWKMVGPHTVQEIMMYHSNEDEKYPRHPGKIQDMKDMRRMIDGYDTGISYMDSHIGQILDKFKQMGIYDDMVIIVSSDHSENQGELGIYGEHATADNGTCRIPMIIKWPEMQSNINNDGFHYNIDLAPTLADMLNQEKPDNWDGQSFAKALIDGEKCGHDYLVLSQCAHVCQRSVRFENWLYMRTYHDGYHLFPKEMLFDLNADPYEQNDIAKQNTDICMKCNHMLSEWHDDMMMSMDCEIDPLWTVMKEGGPMHASGQLKDYLVRLENTGRGWAVPILMEKYPDELK